MYYNDISEIISSNFHYFITCSFRILVFPFFSNLDYFIQTYGRSHSMVLVEDHIYNVEFVGFI
jgi:hypothetical protein